MLIAIGVAALLQGAQPGSAPPSTSDSARAVADARRLIAQFLKDRDAVQRRMPSPRNPVRPFPCYSDRRLMRDPAPGPGFADTLLRIVRNAVDARLNICPLWIIPYKPPPRPRPREIDGRPRPPAIAPVRDHAESIDNALSPRGRDSVRSLRARLIAELMAARDLPQGDPWLTGQLVRLHVDQGEVMPALASVEPCRTTQWWCDALAGYAMHVFGNGEGAERAFNASLAGMPAPTRCDWESLAPVLPPGSRRRYERIPCAERDTINRNVWWLADPLMLEPGNQRRSEHFARRVLLELRASPGTAEHPALAGWMSAAAFRELVMRYGWPTQLSVQNPASERAKISPSYRWPPLRTMPWLVDAERPMQVTDEAWKYMIPARDEDGMWDDSAGTFGVEFMYRRGGPIEQLRSQVGFLRRQGTALAVVGADWDMSVFLPQLDEYRYGVAVSAGPGHPVTGGGGIVSGNGAHGIAGPIESRPLLMSVEKISIHNGVAGRTRFAVDPPRPLAMLPRDSVALSDPLLLRPGEAPATTLGEVTRRIHGSPFIRDPVSIGVFWEIYNTALGDSLDVSLRLIRHRDGLASQMLS